jgi:2-amino-4-hydroxy-6-hydroxymethyldihydropteridine diphosphokinase
MSEVKRLYVGFGANLGDPLATYGLAKSILEQKLGDIVAESKMYESRALTLDGSPSQTNYFNAVIAFDTDIAAGRILQILLETELVFKRKREDSVRWAPRPIDLDILFYGDSVISEEGLTVPHPELQNRDFVLCPLLDIAAEFKHPVTNDTIRALESSLNSRGCIRLIIRSFEIAAEQVDASAGISDEFSV